MAIPGKTKPRGILHTRTGDSRFQLARYVPEGDLALFVEHFWIVHWDLQGAPPQTQETLPHPSVHFTIEEGRTRILGVVTGRFTRVLEGAGRVFGIKFRPGGFYPFRPQSVSDFTDGSLTVEEVFGKRGLEFVDLLLAEKDDAWAAELAESFLLARLPERDENLARIQQVVGEILCNPEITKVDQLVTQFGMSKRTMQRLFAQYVGVGPKWIIQRYRLHEALERLSAGQTIDWPRLALDLGYFDQAHFIREFRTLVGQTPAEYARQRR